MRRWNGSGGLLTVCAWAFYVAIAVAEEGIPGETLDPALNGPGVVESMHVVIARDRDMQRPAEKGRRGEQGVWAVPSRRAMTAPHSGERHVVNKWGDTRMGIGFPTVVNVDGAYFAGQAAEGAWTTGVRVLGYRDGQEVQQTDWFHDIGAEPKWFAMNLKGVDRIVILSTPVLNGGGWYAMDDLTYTVGAEEGAETGKTIVVDFEDVGYDTVLTGTGYAGLRWEVGSGNFEDQGVPAPRVPPGVTIDTTTESEAEEPVPGYRSTLPSVVTSWQGVIRGDAGQSSYPPDSCGAIGPNHYVVVVNRNFSVYDRVTRVRLINTSLGAFLPGSSGDPRVLFDQYSNRWIVHATDFSTRLYLAVSLTSDATGSWFKTSVTLSQGSDASCWPDYPTLGVDANGIYVTAYMVGCGMSIFAIDKAPLIAPTPSLGTVTAWRGLSWEYAIQPCHTYGTASGEFLISTSSTSGLRVRRINPPLTAPTLTTVGTLTVPSFSDPPTAPALGSTTNLDTVDRRLMMALYRNGSIWTCHTINVSGRAACRWYQVNVSPLSLQQSGTVSHSSLFYFFPAIMVNQYGHAVMAFSGSNASQYAGCYYTGRLSTDPAGSMATPVQYKAGTGPQNNIDSYGRNRWGDYSYTTLDPVAQTDFWTIQEYGHGTNIWGTYIAQLTLGGGDCNNNGIPDFLDIQSGTSQDCNSNGVPDECDLAQGTSPDCNGNGKPDECDIAQGISPDCNTNGVPDSCDLTAGRSVDCNSNGVPDECDVAANPAGDCNRNMVPDGCEVPARNGLAGSYFDNLGFAGLQRGRIDSTVNFDWGAGAPWPGFGVDTFSIRWTGFVRTPPVGGTYTFFTRTQDGVRLWVKNQLLVDKWQDQTPTEWSGTVVLDPNREYPLTMEYYANVGNALAELRWQPPGQSKVIIPTTNLIPGRDCNGNGLLDACDFDPNYAFESPVYTPLGFGHPKSFTIPSAPDAVGDVTLTFKAYGDLNYTDENVAVDINGVPVGTVYLDSFLDCIPNQTDTLTVSMTTFNNAKAGGNAVINMVPSAEVNPTQCGSNPTTIQVTVRYVGVPRTGDCNTNGIPDECDIASGMSLDVNANGIPDECEPAVCRGDANCDRTISWRDIDYFVAGMNNNQSAWAAKFAPQTPTCAFANLDVNNDGTVSWRDINPFVALMNTTCP